MNAGETFRRARERNGLSVRELARRCGVSAVYISDIERGNRMGSGVFPCLQRELGVTSNDIDFAYYEHGRIAPDLIFGDEGHVRSCLDTLRRNLMA